MSSTEPTREFVSNGCAPKACSCVGHQLPGVYHLAPCCDEPHFSLDGELRLPEEIHHCSGCGEDYNIFEESHIGHVLAPQARTTGVNKETAMNKPTSGRIVALADGTQVTVRYRRGWFQRVL